MDRPGLPSPEEVSQDGTPEHSIAYLVVAGALAVAFGVFLIVGVLEGSLVKIGIAAAIFVGIVYAVRVYRHKQMIDEMKGDGAVEVGHAVTWCRSPVPPRRISRTRES